MKKQSQNKPNQAVLSTACPERSRTGRMEPILQKHKMSATICPTGNYQNHPLRPLPQNKPNQTQSVVSLSNLFQHRACPPHSARPCTDRLNREDHSCIACFLSHWMGHFSACAGVRECPFCSSDGFDRLWQVRSYSGISRYDL
jgi:hypothetical protein